MTTAPLPKERVEDALRRSNGNLSAAARALGLPHAIYVRDLAERHELLDVAADLRRASGQTTRPPRPLDAAAVARAWAESGGNLSRAAANLGVAIGEAVTRNRLRRALWRFGIVAPGELAPDSSNPGHAPGRIGPPPGE